MSDRYWKDALREAAPAFAKQVAPVYAMLGWTWHDSPTPPDEARILKTLHDLIDNASEVEIDHRGNTICSGGLFVWWERGDCDISAGISFELDHTEYDVRLTKETP